MASLKAQKKELTEKISSLLAEDLYDQLTYNEQRELLREVSRTYLKSLTLDALRATYIILASVPKGKTSEIQRFQSENGP